MAGKRVDVCRYEGVMLSMGEKPVVITDMELEEPLDSSLASLSCIICLRMKALLIYYLPPLFSLLFTLRRSCQTLADRNKISAGELGGLGGLLFFDCNDSRVLLLEGIGKHPQLRNRRRLAFPISSAAFEEGKKWEKKKKKATVHYGVTRRASSLNPWEASSSVLRHGYRLKSYASFHIVSAVSSCLLASRPLTALL